MGMMEPIEYLRQVPLFSRLSDANLEHVAAISHQELFARGDHLAQAGRPGRAFYYIISGEAVVRAVTARGHARPVGFLRAGDYFGVTSLLLGEPHDAEVEATTEVVALVVDRHSFAQLRRQAPELEEQLELPEQVDAKLRYSYLPWLSPGEVVVFFGKRHWIVFLRSMLLPTLISLAIGLLTFALLQALHASWYIALIPSLLVYSAALIWNYVDWRNDYFVVTTRRIVRRELIVFQYESRREAPLSMIQDVDIKRSFVANVLGYGNVIITTAAKSGVDRIVFDHLGNPGAAKDIIFQQLYRSRALTKSTGREEVRRELKRRLGWSTSEELQAQPEVPAEPARAQPERPGWGWLSRLARIRILPALRLEQDSRITWRKHWVFLARRLVKPTLAIAAWALLLVLYIRGYLAFLPVLPGGALVFYLIVAFLLGFWFWYQYKDWENDIYVLTDDRIIDIEKEPLLGREDRREATLDRIQNVNLTMPDAVAVALDYGDVDIDTAGGGGKFTFTHVVAPHTVQQDIMSRVARFRERREQLESQQHRREIAEWFAEYEDLRQQHGGAPPAPPEPPPAEEAGGPSS